MTHKIIVSTITKDSIIKKILFLFIALVLLNSCAIKNNIKDIRGVFCTPIKDESDFTVLKLDSNNTFELERIVTLLGIAHYYSKGEWSYISKRKIILEFEDKSKRTYPSPQPWNLYYDYTYHIKMISKNEVIIFIDNQKEETLNSDGCDCIPERFLINSPANNTLHKTP